MEEISAAPSFLFMATMNPGGDFGKRELSPALRNRFTEVWVPPITDVRDLLQLIGEKLAKDALKCRLGSDADRVPFMELMKSFSPFVLDFLKWFDVHAASGSLRKSEKAEDASKKSAPRVLPITLRDVQSWSRFMSVCIGSLGLQPWVAYVHGAGMVVLDGLGLGTGLSLREVAAIRGAAYEFLFRQIPSDVLASVTAQLSGLLGDIPSAPPQGSEPRISLVDPRVTDGSFVVASFRIPVGPHAIPDRLPYALDAPTTSRNLVSSSRLVAAPELCFLGLMRGSLCRCSGSRHASTSAAPARVA